MSHIRMGWRTSIAVAGVDGSQPWIHEERDFSQWGIESEEATRVANRKRSTCKWNMNVSAILHLERYLYSKMLGVFRLQPRRRLEGSTGDGHGSLVSEIFQRPALPPRPRTADTRPEALLLIIAILNLHGSRDFQL